MLSYWSMHECQQDPRGRKSTARKEPPISQQIYLILFTTIHLSMTSQHDYIHYASLNLHPKMLNHHWRPWLQSTIFSIIPCAWAFLDQLLVEQDHGGFHWKWPKGGGGGVCWTRPQSRCTEYTHSLLLAKWIANIMLLQRPTISTAELMQSAAEYWILTKCVALHIHQPLLEYQHGLQEYTYHSWRSEQTAKGQERAGTYMMHAQIPS